MHLLADHVSRFLNYKFVFCLFGCWFKTFPSIPFPYHPWDFRTFTYTFGWYFVKCIGKKCLCMGPGPGFVHIFQGHLWMGWFFPGPMSWNKTPRNSWMTRRLGDWDLMMGEDQKSHEWIDGIEKNMIVLWLYIMITYIYIMILSWSMITMILSWVSWF